MSESKDDPRCECPECGQYRLAHNPGPHVDGVECPDCGKPWPAWLPKPAGQVDWADADEEWQ